MTEIRSDIRNIAIIAHVDHGKTTLVDGMLKQSKVFRDASAAGAAGERILDSNALERERGITILAKNTAITWNGTKINIVDTPGHADFGGEVERVLNMVDGALLLVDAVEGPMPQTRFVLRKALAQNLRVIVVINKVDRQYARPAEVLNETFDLFIELGANDHQADFPVVYAVGLEGRAGYSAETMEDNLTALFETIIKEIPAPEIEVDAPPRLLVTTLEYDNYKGQIGVGRLRSGVLRRGQQVMRIPVEGAPEKGSIAYLFTYHNLAKQEVDEVRAGDILAFGGFDRIAISDTIADPAYAEALPPISVEQPTVRMTFGINTSPFAGREGKTGLGTSRKLRERLYNETRHNLALRVEDGDSPEKFIVSGRGELHLGILIETMRREGYEFEVSKPEVILQDDAESGELLEPIEEVHIEVADDLTGTVVEMLGARRGRMINMSTESGTTYMTYLVPTRGLLGLRSRFLTATGGMGQLHTIFYGYEPYAGSIPGRQFGSLVAWETGKSTNYAFDQVKQRGTFLIEPGAEVYEGMVVGIHIRAEDLAVNVCKTKQLSAVHTVYFGKEEKVNIDLSMSLDDYIEFIAEDELLEVTPNTLRVRKRILNNEKRLKDLKAKEKLAEA
ncbi:MAG: translational GTPase TypA [Anaerolineae bacterium]|nr:translational GTPase TypA [Anaerolineae bacterium]NUQ02902.1 translational GTPase TypA [Anaerolineae bacterium]